MRIVALGLRVRYTGTTLNSAGEVFSAQTNPRITMNGYGIDDFKKQQSWKTKSFAVRDWFGVTRMITSKLDSEFLCLSPGGGSWVTADGGLSTNETVNYLSIIMQGTPGVPFEFEAVCHFEVIGPNLDTQALTNLDTTGTEAVISSLHRERAKDNNTPDHMMSKSGSQKVGGVLNLLKEGAKRLIPVIGTAFPQIAPLTSMVSSFMN